MVVKPLNRSTEKYGLQVHYFRFGLLRCVVHCDAAPLRLSHMFNRVVGMHATRPSRFIRPSLVHMCECVLMRAGWVWASQLGQLKPAVRCIYGCGGCSVLAAVVCVLHAFAVGCRASLLSGWYNAG